MSLFWRAAQEVGVFSPVTLSLIRAIRLPLITPSYRFSNSHLFETKSRISFSILKYLKQNSNHISTHQLRALSITMGGKESTPVAGPGEDEFVEAVVAKTSEVPEGQ